MKHGRNMIRKVKIFKLCGENKKVIKHVYNVMETLVRKIIIIAERKINVYQCIYEY